jgi:hypothetical protein
MSRKTISLILLIISAISIQLYLVDNHGRLIISALMAKDWIFCGISFFAFLAAIYLIAGKSQRKSRLFKVSG